MKRDLTARRGPIAWMADNAVAANLLMMIFIVGGLLFARGIKQEVFPEVDLDAVLVSVAYPGASPEEVEEGIVLAVEEEIRGVDGIKEVSASVTEGGATVVAELFIDADADQALNDIKSAVDRITSLPEQAERPVISLATNRTQVLNLLVHGELDARVLDSLAEDLRAGLLKDPRITLVEVAGLPPPEISIEVAQETLRRYGLTLDEIARQVAQASIDLPGGAVRTAAGEVLVRTTERRDYGDEFADIAVIADADGSRVLLGEIAEIVDGFRETDEQAFYDGEPAVRLKVYRTGEQSPIDVSSAVQTFVAERREILPGGVRLSIVDDASEYYDDRVRMLLKNGMLGVLLVLIVLGIFLQPRLAFWVTLGMPISFLGAFLFFPALDVSINLISLFAFILVLGIVVDDAVVVGEAVFAQRSKYNDTLTSSIAGTREVMTPVVFAVLTTVIAFAPLLFVPGVMGKFFMNIPLIVIPILLISLVESLLILPAHLAHVRRAGQFKASRLTAPFYRWQRRFSRGMEWIIEHRVRPLIAAATEARYLTLAISVAALGVSLAIVASGRVPTAFFPRVEADFVSASIEMPFGAPVEATRRAMSRVVEAAERTAVELGGEDAIDKESGLVRGFYSEIGTATPDNDPAGMTWGADGGHLAFVTVYLAPGGERTVGAEDFSRQWRKNIGEVPGVERLAFEASTGPAAGEKIAIQLSHQNEQTLEHAARRLAAALGEYVGVFDIDDGLEQGKPQLDLELRPAARGFGVTESELATQLRSAFYGAEALRQQRGRDELRVYVRLPREQRDSLYAVENLIVRTPGGGEVPLLQAASIEQGASFTRIDREDGRRIVEVSSDFDENVASVGQIVGNLEREVLPRLQDEIPGLSYSLSGEQEAQNESIAALERGMLLALLAMYAMMAVAFKSYSQPLVVLFAVPFGFIGAVLGHFIMGYTISFVSMLGMVALSGVVINDSLVLISAINDYRRDGMEVGEAVIAGATRRVRPVVLTSLTTFFGLAPMIFETSLQARFLIPMAISLGFGVLFVTGIAILLVPAAYRAVEDARQFLSRRIGAAQPVGSN